MKTVPQITLIVLSVISFATALVAQESGELMDLSLDEILNVEVVTATKSARKIDEVPAVMEIVTHEQIKQRGYRHLADVLNGISDNHEDRSNWGIGEPTNQNTGFGFRFDTGQNILFLFNGQRLNAFLPGNRFGGEEYLLDNVERIEIIRGPGSALYGANAFTAVVNIISKSSEDNDEKVGLKVGGNGDFSSSGRVATTSLNSKLGKDGFISGAFRYGAESGQDIMVQNGLFGDRKLRDGAKHTIDGEVFFSYNDFNSYLKITNQKRNTFTGFNGVSPYENDNLTLSMYGYSLGADYTQHLSKKIQLKGTAGWHQDNWTEVALIPMFKVNAAGDSLLVDNAGFPILDTLAIDRNGQIVNTPFFIDGQGADTRTLDGELQFTANYTQNNNIIFGVNVSNDQVLNATRPTELQLDPFGIIPFQELTDDANNWLFDTDASRMTIGFYGQVDYDLGDYLTFNTGARLDLYSGTGVLNKKYNEFNPRVGLVYKNQTTGYVKLMYGTATRVPNGFETLSAVALLGSPNNTPERIRTLQAMWLKNWNKSVRTEFGTFHSVISNHLVTDANLTEDLKALGFIGQFVNVGSDIDLRSQGVNGKMTFRVNDIDASVNFTQYFNTNDGTGNEIAYITKTMVNANVNIPMGWLNLNVGGNYRGGVTQPDSDTREKVKSYLLLNTTLLVRPDAFPLELRIGARNLLDSDIRYPSSNLDFTEHFPGRGFTLWSGLSYTF